MSAATGVRRALDVRLAGLNAPPARVDRIHSGASLAGLAGASPCRLAGPGRSEPRNGLDGGPEAFHMVNDAWQASRWTGACRSDRRVSSPGHPLAPVAPHMHHKRRAIEVADGH